MSKVKGGTVDHSAPSLCKSCRYATIVQGHSLNQTITSCSRIGGEGKHVVPFPVSSCNEYDDKATPTLWEMKQIYWEVRTDRVGKIGFTSPEERAAARKGSGSPYEAPGEDDKIWDPLKKQILY